MNDAFTKAFEKLRQTGEGLFGNAPETFTPVGIRADVKDQGPFYHGTQAALVIGDLIEAGHTSNYDPTMISNFVYFTSYKEVAIMASESVADGKNGKIYIVEPTGTYGDDPNLTDKKFPGNPTKSYRSNAPLRIVGELTEYENFFSPEARKKILERTQKMQAMKPEIIN
ncbi:MAG: NAD(+)--rifampin ADP-ribosyltransferase [Defluviitaleaceae bacterium]|nr:NAD(+)--rifampin ADP-ribosyltransferase [Defluviitaleaceae bacterium]